MTTLTTTLRYFNNNFNNNLTLIKTLTTNLITTLTTTLLYFNNNFNNLNNLILITNLIKVFAIIRFIIIFKQKILSNIY